MICRSCAQAQAVLDAYISRRCTEEEVRAVREHLSGCPDCEHEYEVSEVLVTVMRRSCREEAPAELRARILASIHRASPKR